MKKFENKIIVSDLDGTFLGDGAALVERNLRAIEYFKSEGGYFTVATGRVTDHVIGSIPNVNQLVNFPAVICNGACLYDFAEDKVAMSQLMDYESIVDIYEYIHEAYPDVGVRASTYEYCFVTAADDLKNPFLKGDFEKYSNMKNLVAPIEKWKELHTLKLVLRVREDEVDELMDSLRTRFGERFSCTQSWATIIDIQMGGVNKGAAIEKYVRTMLGDGARIYACGDYVNDLEMLSAADVSVCPSNAHERVKEICDLCLCNNNEGLIADLVEWLEENEI